MYPGTSRHANDWATAKATVTAGLRCAAEIRDTEHRQIHGESPASRDDDPSGSVTLCAMQHDVRHHAVAQQYEQRGSDQLRQIRVHL